MSALGKTARQCERESMHAISNQAQAFRTVIDAVHAGHHCEQHLRSANVRGGLVAANVLLARLDGHAQRAISLRIAGNADDSPRKFAHVRFAGGDERCVRTTKTHRHTKALRTADGNVRAP